MGKITWADRTDIGVPTGATTEMAAASFNEIKTVVNNNDDQVNADISTNASNISTNTSDIEIGREFQTITITNANNTDGLVLGSKVSKVEIILDAALTADWQPATITGWVEDRIYTFDIVKKSNNGVDMSVARAALNVGYDDDINPFAALIGITTTQQRATISAKAFKTTYGQFGAMIITDSNYIE